MLPRLPSYNRPPDVADLSANSLGLVTSPLSSPVIPDLILDQWDSRFLHRTGAGFAASILFRRSSTACNFSPRLEILLSNSTQRVITVLSCLVIV